MERKTEEILKEIHFGVDYYPEHWPKERWETDARLMKDMGIQIVRMAEFAWQALEPEKGRFCFEWLDEAIALLGSYGIYTMLGTPTAAPPAWIIEENPDILPMDSQGQRKGFGGRHHDCQSNEAYRIHIRRLVTAMAEHYKDNPYVLAWQIDNELGNSHEDLCMCDSCQRAFQKWLEKKYQTIEKVNETWGTVFWSQTYDKFTQIPAPRQTPTMHNPSLLLDWKRFCSDLVIDFLSMQAEIIKKIAPHQQITHNLMGFYDKTNYFQMAEKLDFASNDQYPTGYYFAPPGQGASEVAACMDFIRNVKKKNFWMLELESGPTGGSVIGTMPKPGQNRYWTAQCVAHGADAIVYFRWRTCLFGSEQFWHGILPHSGIPGRRYEELKKTIQELMPVMRDVQGIVKKSRIGILFSYEEEWALNLQPQHPDLRYLDTVLQYYDGFYRKGLDVDFLSTKDGLEDYSVIVAPLLYLMTPALEKKLTEYVEKGGHLLLTMRTGVMNEANVCMSHCALPGNLSTLVGAEIEEYDCLYDRSAGIRCSAGEGSSEKWCDILKLKGAEGILYYTTDFYAGKPAASKNRYGKGTAWYIGTDPEEKLLDWILEKLLEEAGETRKRENNTDVELVCRRGREKEYLFLLNGTSREQMTELPQDWGGTTVQASPYEVQILEREYGTDEIKVTGKSETGA